MNDIHPHRPGSEFSRQRFCILLRFPGIEKAAAMHEGLKGLHMVPAQTDEILTSFDDDIHSFFLFCFFCFCFGGGVFVLCVRGWGAGDVGGGGRNTGTAARHVSVMGYMQQIQTVLFFLIDASFTSCFVPLTNTTRVSWCQSRKIRF